MTQDEERLRQAGFDAGTALGRSAGFRDALTQISGIIEGIKQSVVAQSVDGHLLTLEMHEDKADGKFHARVYYEGRLIHDDYSLDISNSLYYAGQSIKAHMEKIGRHHKDWDD